MLIVQAGPRHLRATLRVSAVASVEASDAAAVKVRIFLGAHRHISRRHFFSQPRPAPPPAGLKPAHHNSNLDAIPPRMLHAGR
jgi:hypothetical protein